MVDADTAAELSREVRKRASFFADELSGAIAQVEELYRSTVWPEHEVLLRKALEDIQRLFVPVKDVILTKLAGRL